jgi:hypothetical protein
MLKFEVETANDLWYEFGHLEEADMPAKLFGDWYVSNKVRHILAWRGRKLHIGDYLRKFETPDQTK